MDQGAIPPSLPFRLAAAYGARDISARPAPAEFGARPQPRVLLDRDTVELSSSRGAGIQSGGARRLVAAAVDVPVDFNIPAAPAPVVRESLAMYRHPADKNAAATAVNAGRRVDLTG